MKHIFTPKRICRAGVIAALYVALTYAFMPVSYQGIMQIRPGEALTILPLFFPEAVPALWVGCMLSNLASPFIVYDVPIGGAATLLASLLTFFVGRLLREQNAKTGTHVARMALGGFFPVIVNAILIPVVIVFLCKDTGDYAPTVAYWVNFGSMCLSQGLWIYGLGTPLYLLIARMRKKGVGVFCDGKKPQNEKEPAAT